MIKITAILLICVMHIPAIAEQQNISKNTLLTRSNALASEMGATFQLAQNCGQDMPNIAASRATTLFTNYFAESEVTKIMSHYHLLVAQEKGKSCNRDKVNFHMLMNKIAVYIGLASRFNNN